MILGYVFLWLLIGSCFLVAIDRMLGGLVLQCQSCDRTRVRRGYCSHCGVVGNPVPEKPVQRRPTVRFH